ncbi:MAG TPA: pyruvate formate lyase-activating protein [Clostridiales bacterium]|jgi:pyruvate formate lyase activating enzyme|nr:pyruvate formate lyase-activating protein [Clostridiales bacterium]
MDIKGRIHSVETMGTVDGPGIRYVIFMQGCPLRCIYCHNRDSWDPRGGREITVDELVEDINKYLVFIKGSGGGVTATGGEPLMQPEFVRELFIKVRAMGLNTAVDTSGFIDIDRAEKLLEVTDLVLLSIKHVVEERHREITGVGTRKIISFLNYLREIGKPVWIRYLIIPGYTDDPEDLNRLALMLRDYDNIELVDILPYHDMGAYKWEELGYDYPLKGVAVPTKQDMERAKAVFRRYGLPMG